MQDYPDSDGYDPAPSESRLTRAERLQLAAAALRGVLAGAAREVVSWLIEEAIHH